MRPLILATLIFIGLLLNMLLYSSAEAQLPKTQHDDAFIRRLMVNRINLQEKANRRMTSLPAVLLNAWRMGDLQGYYPNTYDAPMPWRVFADYFRVPANQLDEARATFACCSKGGQPTSNSSIPYKEQLQSVRYFGFTDVVELIEDKTFNQVTSTEQYETHYIRLVWTDPQGARPARNAVVFRYEDVAQVLDRVDIPHPRNDAARLSLRQLIDQHNFAFYPINISGNPLISLEEARQRSNQQVEESENLQER